MSNNNNNDIVQKIIPDSANSPSVSDVVENIEAIARQNSAVTRAVREFINFCFNNFDEAVPEFGIKFYSDDEENDDLLLDKIKFLILNARFEFNNCTDFYINFDGDLVIVFAYLSGYYYLVVPVQNFKRYFSNSFKFGVNI